MEHSTIASVPFRPQAVMKGVTAIAVIAKAAYNPINTGIT